VKNKGNKHRNSLGSGLRDAKHAKSGACSHTYCTVSFLFTNHEQPSENLHVIFNSTICFVERRDFIYALRSPPTAWALNYRARRTDLADRRPFFSPLGRRFDIARHLTYAAPIVSLCNINPVAGQLQDTGLSHFRHCRCGHQSRR
jgi:hypothetical protein